MKLPKGDARLFIPPIGIFFLAFASLVFSIIRSEVWSQKVLFEDESVQIAYGIAESSRWSQDGTVTPSDPRVLGFGVYKQNGERTLGFGSAAQRYAPGAGDSPFAWNAAKRTLTLTRSLGSDTGRRPRGADSGTYHGQPAWMVMTLDASDYYRHSYFLSVTSILAPLVAVLVGALFISLLLRNLQYRDAAEKREMLAFLGESARTLVHEIRNPLGAIRLHVDVLRRKYRAGDAPDVEAIGEETQRLELLVRRISEFLKNPAGSPVRIDLAGFLRDSCERCEIRAGDLGNGPLPVLFDPELLRSVLENLVRNARESYGDDAADRDVLVTLSTRGAEAVITVADRGKGVPAGLRERVFDPFFTDKPQGSGIGLPLARRFVDAAGGSLRLEARRGGGTEARVFLPLAERA